MRRPSNPYGLAQPKGRTRVPTGARGGLSLSLPEGAQRSNRPGNWLRGLWCYLALAFLVVLTAQGGVARGTPSSSVEALAAASADTAGLGGVELAQLRAVPAETSGDDAAPTSATAETADGDGDAEDDDDDTHCAALVISSPKLPALTLGAHSIRFGQCQVQAGRGNVTTGLARGPPVLV